MLELDNVVSIKDKEFFELDYDNTIRDVYIVEKRKYYTSFLILNKIDFRNVHKVTRSEGILLTMNMMQGVVSVAKYKVSKDNKKSYEINKRAKVISMRSIKEMAEVNKNRKLLSSLLFDTHRSFFKNLDNDSLVLLLLNLIENRDSSYYLSQIKRDIRNKYYNDEIGEVEGLPETDLLTYLTENIEVTYKSFRDFAGMAYDRRLDLRYIFGGLLADDNERNNKESALKVKYSQEKLSKENDKNSLLHYLNLDGADGKTISKCTTAILDLTEKLGRQVLGYMIRELAKPEKLLRVYDIVRGLDDKHVLIFKDYMSTTMICSLGYRQRLLFEALFMMEGSTKRVEQFLDFYNEMANTYGPTSASYARFVPEILVPYLDYFIFINKNKSVADLPVYPKNLPMAFIDGFESQKRVDEMKHNSDSSLIWTYTKNFRVAELFGIPIVVDVKYTDENKVLKINREFSMVLPMTSGEFIKEGADLKHCASIYFSIVKSGKAIVLMLRSNKEIDKPLYTIEIDPDFTKVIQVSGKYDIEISNDDDPKAVEALISFCKDNNLDFTEIKNLKEFVPVESNN